MAEPSNSVWSYYIHYRVNFHVFSGGSVSHTILSTFPFDSPQKSHFRSSYGGCLFSDHRPTLRSTCQNRYVSVFRNRHFCFIRNLPLGDKFSFKSREKFSCYYCSYCDLTVANQNNVSQYLHAIGYVQIQLSGVRITSLIMDHKFWI